MLARRPGRLLVCGPMFPAQGIGGLQAVVTDLVDGLARRGWDVDTLPIPFVADWRGSASWRSRLAVMSRGLVPQPWRFMARILVHDVGRLREQSDVLREAERRLVDGRYSAVLACVDNAPVGLASLVTRVAARPVLFSLTALASELRHRAAIDAVGQAARAALGRGLHADLLRPVDPGRVSSAVFASRTWRDAGVAAGLDARAVEAIYFGVRAPARLAPAQPPSSPLRLLWAGRLSPEKGLHRFLPAIALVRRLMPVQLTVLDAGGPETYRRSILRTIDRLRLDDVVRWQAAVPREDLVGTLAAHDVFLFYSIFDEPVAQLLLSAFAAGTIVVAPVPRASSVIKPGETAMTFADERPATVANAIVQAARDEAVRRRVRTRAFVLVQTEQSLDRTIDDYDRLLEDVTGVRRQARA